MERIFLWLHGGLEGIQETPMFLHFATDCLCRQEIPLINFVQAGQWTYRESATGQTKQADQLIAFFILGTTVVWFPHCPSLGALLHWVNGPNFLSAQECSRES